MHVCMSGSLCVRMTFCDSSVHVGDQILISFSAISRTFNYRTPNIIRWILRVFSCIVISIGRPERSAPFVLIRPRLKLLYQL